MILRAATRADASAIAAIHIVSWQAAYAHLLPQSFLDSLSLADFTANWQQWLPAQPGQIVLVAEDPAGQLQGFAGAGPIREPRPPFTAELYALYIHPAAQRQGIGRRLVHAISAELATFGHQNLILWSLRDNLATTFYQRIGGQPVAESTAKIADLTLPTTAFGWHSVPVVCPPRYRRLKTRPTLPPMQHLPDHIPPARGATRPSTPLPSPHIPPRQALLTPPAGYPPTLRFGPNPSIFNTFVPEVQGGEATRLKPATPHRCDGRHCPTTCTVKVEDAERTTPPMQPTDPTTVRTLAEHARAAARTLAPLPLADRNAALARIADALDQEVAQQLAHPNTEQPDSIFAANARDLALAQTLVTAGDLSPSNFARLPLTPAKLAEMAAQVRAVQLLPDPLGRTLDAIQLDHGLDLQKRSVPLGVLAVIFEARPDAVTQIAALALKSGNAVLLKPGREVEHTAAALVTLIQQAIAITSQGPATPTPSPQAVISTAPHGVISTSPQAVIPTSPQAVIPTSQNSVISNSPNSVISTAPQVVISTEGKAQPGRSGETCGVPATTARATISTEGDPQQSRSGETSSSTASETQIPANAVQLLLGRAAVAELLTLSALVDLVIPRGSRALVEHIQATTRIPVLGHADGICHVYVDQHADLDLALAIVDDSKTDYPAVCNAAETCLVHEAIAPQFLPALITRLRAKGVHFRADQPVRDLLTLSIGSRAENFSPAPNSVLSTEAPTTNPVISTEDEAQQSRSGETRISDHTDIDLTDPDSWHTEYGDLTLALRIVPSLSAAIDHIHQHGSAHTETICTTDPAAAERFLNEVDAASVMLNASTRFADGFRYGLGAEVGVSTSRIHARGPVGLEGLTTTKFVLRGHGQLAADYRGPNARPFTHTRPQNKVGQPKKDQPT